MQVIKLGIEGAATILPDTFADSRGVFHKIFCSTSLRESGYLFSASQLNVSTSYRAGTLRGFHYQVPPFSEAKYVRCCRGQSFHCICDLRPESETFLRTIFVQLEAENPMCLMIPERCAHAMQTLADDTEIHYMSNQSYSSDSERGIRWDDPDLDIQWPHQPTSISEKDRGLPCIAETLDQIIDEMSTESFVVGF